MKFTLSTALYALYPENVIAIRHIWDVWLILELSGSISLIFVLHDLVWSLHQIPTLNRRGI